MSSGELSWDLLLFITPLAWDRPLSPAIRGPLSKPISTQMEGLSFFGY
jgi:hypothetical protein